MPYADTDFFLALLKEKDWLHEKAKKLLVTYRNNLRTSSWTIIELLLVSQEYSLDPEILIISIQSIVHIEGNVNALLAAAHFMKESSLTTFDALHAVSCDQDAIISSDSVFDTLGLKRIKLEE